MIHNRTINHTLWYAILTIALLAVVILMVNLILPVDLPVRYHTAGESRPAQALNRGQRAEADRLTGIAIFFEEKTSLNRLQKAYGDRLQAEADKYLLQHADLPLPQLTDAARYTGQAIRRYGLFPDEMTPALKILLRK